MSPGETANVAALTSARSKFGDIVALVLAT
jgi:hypothetical protein